MDEDGYKDWKTSSAIEEVTEGEVEKEDGDVVAQPGELLPVPGGYWLVVNRHMMVHRWIIHTHCKDDCQPDPHVWYGNQGE